jgi:hypothetical protein
MTITRTIEIKNITPEELAAVFCEMWAEEQAAFFGHVADIAKTWPGAGMCQQSHAIAAHLTSDGRYAIERLADHAGLIPTGAA